MLGRPRVFTEEERLIRRRENCKEWRTRNVIKCHEYAISEARKERARASYLINKDAINTRRRQRWLNKDVTLNETTEE